MSSYLNKLQEARKIAVEKYLNNWEMDYTVVKRCHVDYYSIPNDEYLADGVYSTDELVDWFGIKIKVEELS